MVTETPSASRYVEPDRLSNLVGAGYVAFEDAVLMKLPKVRSIFLAIEDSVIFI